jgi:cellulose synthase/poly-beta-1,6-N-acetylglucosamine synthase-like glycosyltransferase
MLPFSDESLPHVTILLPTLGRPDGLQRCLASIDKLVYPKSHMKVVIDDGDGTVPQKVNRMARANQDTDCYVYAANDIQFYPWCIYRAAIKSKECGLVAFNEGPVLPDEGNICTHFLITRDLANRLGEIFSEKFAHCGCDNLLWAKAKKLGEAVRCEDAKIIHYHFSKGSPMDAVYKIGWAHVEEDRKALAAELEALKS